LVNIFVRLLDLPAALLYSMVLAFCTLGVYSLRFTIFDVFLAIFFGVAGYFMRKHNYPAAPLLLALVLGEMIEQALRRALGFSNGDWSIFFTRPISLGFQILIVGTLLYSGFSYLRKKRSS
jgi:putative tricarboxylic transport membrane protein